MKNADKVFSMRLAGAGTLSALTASLCCITPLLALFSGVTGAASTFSWLEPARPYLIGATVLILGFAWYQKFKKSPYDPNCACDGEEKETFIQSKLFLGLITLLALTLLAFPVYSHVFYPAQSASTPISSDTNIYQLDLEITGMTCTGCEEHVKHAINQLPGILHAQASNQTGKAIVQYDNSLVTKDEIVAAVNGTGYQVVKAGELKIN